MTLYAQWAKKSCKVKFYANGGSGKMAKQTLPFGVATKLSANTFTRPDYAFRGCKLLQGPLEIPDTVTEIGLGAFESCESFRSLKLPAGLRLISRSSFGVPLASIGL